MRKFNMLQQADAAGETISANGTNIGAGLGLGIRYAGLFVQVHGPTECQIVVPVNGGQQLIDVLLEHLQILRVIHNAAVALAQSVLALGMRHQTGHRAKGLGIVAVVRAHGAVEQRVLAMPGDDVLVQEYRCTVALARRATLQAQVASVYVLALYVPQQQLLIPVQRQAVPAHMQLSNASEAQLFVRPAGQEARKGHQARSTMVNPCCWTFP